MSYTIVQAFWRKVKKRKYQKSTKKGLTKLAYCAKINKLIHVIGVPAMHGEVSEWFKELVLKSSDAATRRGFESHSLRQHTMEVYTQSVSHSVNIAN